MCAAKLSVQVWTTQARCTMSNDWYETGLNLGSVEGAICTLRARLFTRSSKIARRLCQLYQRFQTHAYSTPCTIFKLTIQEYSLQTRKPKSNSLKQKRTKHNITSVQDSRRDPATHKATLQKSDCYHVMTWTRMSTCNLTTQIDLYWHTVTETVELYSSL